MDQRNTENGPPEIEPSILVVSDETKEIVMVYTTGGRPQAENTVFGPRPTLQGCGRPWAARQMTDHRKRSSIKSGYCLLHKGHRQRKRESTTLTRRAADAEGAAVFLKKIFA